MKVRHLLIILMFLPIIAFSQKAVYRQVVNAKSNGSQFRELNVFKYVSSNLRDEKVNPEVLREGVLLLPNAKELNDILLTQPEFLTVVIPVSANSSIKVDLLKHNIFAEGFFVSENAKPNSPVSYKEGVHYKGVIQTDSNSIVAFSFFKDEIVAMISDNSGNRVIGRINKDFSKTHLFYNDFNLQVRNPFDCSTQDDGKTYMPSQLNRGGGNTTSSLGDCIDIYIEVDNDVVTDKGGTVNTVNYITALFNQCIILYANETLSVAISQIMCWTTVSPYASLTVTSALLAAYQANTGTFNGDLSHLITYKGGGGQAAGFSGICNVDPDQSKCVSKINSTYLNVPTYSWSVMVITHEMGHLIGSRHTHACVWNGNNTAIDGCSGATEGGCTLPGNPAGGGTIMSYCHQQSVGINLNLGFGPQPGNVIRNSVLNGACLDVCGFTSCTDGFMNGDETGTDCGGSSCPTCPVTCTAPSGVTVTSISIDNATINWTAVVGAISYTLEYKLNSSPTWIVASSTISNTTSYYITGLVSGSLYDYRLRTNCSSGSSSYFQSQFTTITAAACNSNYEPNESRPTAATIPANTIITATIGTTSDLDYYTLTTTATSDFVVTLTNLADDYDMVVQSSTGTQLGISQNGGTTNETITLAARAAGTYYFYVYGYAGANSTTVCYNLNVAVTATTGCLAPTGLAASNITTTTATVSWSSIPSALTYNVEYKLSTSGTWIVASSTYVGTSYNFTGLTPGSLYNYRIRSNCSSGNSSYATANFTASPLCIINSEPNESLAAAVLISENIAVSGGINTATDLDFYKVVTTGVVNFNVTLTNLPADFDLEMYSSTGTLLGSSANGGTISESIALTNMPAGTYIFNVAGWNGAFSTSVCYNLLVGTTPVITNYSLQVTAIIEGYYLGSGTMRAVADPTLNPTVCDTIEVQLANSTSPYAIAYTVKGVISTSGVGTFLFPIAVANGNYYIVIKHRNALQTWSSNTVSLAGTSFAYNFTSSAGQAHGSNQYIFSDGKAAIYSGDVNQDNIINSTDFNIINSNVNQFLIGYLLSDLTGDRCVEASDYSLIENHSGGLSISKP
ncbi:MAG: fibronectin type III domain-containing protein [Bacteroidia bacterium]|nr:fibronectin type III domain-containing protein [Bacteroidia bacterium]